MTLKSAVGGGDVCPSSSINSATVSPVNAARLVQLANVAIDSHENALDCRVDSASLAQHDAADGIKSEDAAGQSCDVAGSLVTDSHLSRGKLVKIIKYKCSVLGVEIRFTPHIGCWLDRLNYCLLLVFRLMLVKTLFTIAYVQYNYMMSLTQLLTNYV